MLTDRVVFNEPLEPEIVTTIWWNEESPDKGCEFVTKSTKLVELKLIILLIKPWLNSKPFL